MTKQRFGCIYRLTNLITKKTYIGKSVNFKQRMSAHKGSIKRPNTYLSSSIKKHGWDNFKKEIIIDDVPEEDLSNLEISYIEVENTLAPNGYNLTLGGEGNIGWKPSKETREKISQAAIRRQANRDQVGCVAFDKSMNKYQVIGPSPCYKYIGRYFTKEKAEKVLKHYLQTGERIDSDRKERKLTGSVRKTKNGKRYQARYKKNNKEYSKTFNTKEECEEWLKTEIILRQPN